MRTGKTDITIYDVGRSDALAYLAQGTLFVGSIPADLVEEVFGRRPIKRISELLRIHVDAAAQL
jgi:hypothetical protein